MNPFARPGALVSLAALGLALVALTHGCNTGSTGLDNRRFPCTQDTECLAGYVCSLGECTPEGEPPDEPDGGTPDDGGTDGGTDGGVPDSGVPDSGVPDSGVPDSGVPDSGVPDAGPVIRPTQLAFATPPRAVDVGECSPVAVELETRSADGGPAPVATATTVTLKSRKNDLVFFPNDRCRSTQILTQVAVPAGGTRAFFHFRGSTAGASPIDATAPGLTPASQDAIIRNGVPTSVVFTSAAQTLSAGTCSGAVVLEARNAFGAATSFASPTAAGLTLTPSGGPLLYSDATCTNAIPDATFAPGAPQTTFYFKGNTGGTFTLTARPSGFNAVSQSVTILSVVRTGTCTLADTASSVTCPISPPQQDVAKTMLMFQAGSNSAEPSSANVRCVLTNTSTITCTRGGTVGAATVSWQTAELASGMKVQHLTTSCSAAATAFDVPITPVASMSNTFLLVSSQIVGATQDTDDFFTATMGGVDHVDVQFGAPCTGSWAGAIQVVEFTGATVTRGTTGPMTGTQLTVTGLPASGLSNTALLFTYRVSAASQLGICDRMLQGVLTSSSQLTFTRSKQDTGCENATIEAISWERINFGDRARTQHQSIDVSDLAQSDTAGISAVDPTRTLVFSSGQALSGQGGGETDYTVDDVLGTSVARHTLLSPTVLEVRRDATVDADAEWFSTVLQLIP
jgi:hypothetical protein